MAVYLTPGTQNYSTIFLRGRNSPEKFQTFPSQKKKNNPTKNKAPKIKNLASSIAQNLLKTPSEKFPKIKHKRQYT